MPGPLSLGPDQAWDVGPNLSYKPYFDQLKAPVHSYSVQDKDAEVSPSTPESPTQPTTRVYLKVLKRQWAEPRWTGPHEVVELTSYAVRLKGRKHWYHLIQMAPDHTAIPT